MRIVQIGNHAAEFSTESDLRKSLCILGHDVWPVQESSDLKSDGILEICKAHGADLVLWSHSHGPGWDWPADDLVAQHDVPIIAFTLDLFRGLRRHDPDYTRKHPWFRCHQFWQPDEPDYLRSVGVNAFFSAPGILETSCYAAAPNPLHPAYGKIIFVGSRKYHDVEWPWRGQLLDFLEKEYGDKFLHYDHGSGMRGHALNELYASAAVVVGDSCFASPESRYTSDRLYESLGRGANLVYPDVKMDLALRACLLTYEPGDFAGTRHAIDVAFRMAMKNTESPSSPVSVVRREHTYTERLRAILAQVKP